MRRSPEKTAEGKGCYQDYQGSQGRKVECNYLDSSALAKRYGEEKGSHKIDRIFEAAEKGEVSVFYSALNVGELAVVFDKYEREGMLDAKAVMKTFLEEMKRLGKSRAAETVAVSSSWIAKAVTLTFKHHVYVADALQVVSCQIVTGAGLVTADHRLAGIAANERLNTTVIG